MYEYEADVANFAKYFDIYNLMRISKGATADQLKKWLISEGMPETSARRHIKEFTEDYEGWLYDYDEESEEYSVSKSGIAGMVHSAYEEAFCFLESEIPISVRAAETSIEGTSIYMHNPSGKVAKAYENLTKELFVCVI